MKGAKLTVLVFLILLSGCVGGLSGEGDHRTDRTPVISDFPEMFDTEPVIVIPDSSTAVEQTTAKRVGAIVGEETGSTPSVITNSELTDAQRDGALIVIGEPANSSFDRIVPEASASVSTLGKRQGRVVITENPQNQSQQLMLVGGSDVFGLWAVMNTLDETDTQTADITSTYGAVSQEELDRLESSDSTGGQLLLQVNAKHRYITEGNTTMGGYINDLKTSELLFQRVTIYTTSQFNRSEMTAFRTQGVQISQKNWIQGGDSGSYVATVPIDELSRFVENPRVTRIETRENVFTTSRGVEPVKPTS